ncbi:universal stress protein family protein [Peptococcaceae bacterium CEB3]|nr:universal stress protein family protein [Peptococcaceae bacterium CEB3]
MNDSRFKVLLYSDGSHQAFSAAVYTATLLKNTPNMYLTVVQLQECEQGGAGTEYSWKELRPKYKRYYWGCIKGSDYRWIDTWPARPTEEWMKRVLSEADGETRRQYDEILQKTNDIFALRAANVSHQELCTSTSVADAPDISETVDMILEYATKNAFELIIMGTRGLSSFHGLIHGSLAHTMLNRSGIPVLLIKKLPQEFIDNYLAEGGA